jgi:hypothetical protein
VLDSESMKMLCKAVADPRGSLRLGSLALLLLRR